MAQRLSLLGEHKAASKPRVKESGGRPEILFAAEQLGVEGFSQLASPARKLKSFQIGASESAPSPACKSE